MVTTPVGSQGGGIIIDGADDSVTLTVSGSSALETLINNVAPHIILQSANDNRLISIPPFPGDLQTRLDQIPGRIIIQSANGNKEMAMSYPLDIINDTTKPTLVEVEANPAGDDQATIRWRSDEFTSGVVEYGSASGNYTESVADPLYSKLHQVTISGLTPGETYYYRLTLTDRSGNTRQSGEYTFQSSISLYLPAIVR